MVAIAVAAVIIVACGQSISDTQRERQRTRHIDATVKSALGFDDGRGFARGVTLQVTGFDNKAQAAGLGVLIEAHSPRVTYRIIDQKR